MHSDDIVSPGIWGYNQKIIQNIHIFTVIKLMRSLQPQPPISLKRQRELRADTDSVPSLLPATIIIISIDCLCKSLRLPHSSFFSRHFYPGLDWLKNTLWMRWQPITRHHKCTKASHPRLTWVSLPPGERSHKCFQVLNGSIQYP